MGRRNKKNKEAKQRKTKIFFVVLVSVTALLIAGGVTAYVLLVDNGGVIDSGGIGDDPSDDDTTNGGYEPVHAVGGTDEEYWTRYPAKHLNSGNAVSFPAWVDGYVGSKVLLILVHSQSCAPCIQQGDDMSSVYSFQVSVQVYFSSHLICQGSELLNRMCFQTIFPHQMHTCLSSSHSRNPDIIGNIYF